MDSLNQQNRVREIAEKEPIKPNVTYVPGHGGPGWWVAIGTLLGVIAILAIAVYFFFQESQATLQRSQSDKVIQEGLKTQAEQNGKLLSELQVTESVAKSEAVAARDALRLSLDCLFIRERYGERPRACTDVNRRVDEIRRGGMPFSGSTNGAPPRVDRQATPSTSIQPRISEGPQEKPPDTPSTTSTTTPARPDCAIEVLGLKLAC